MNPDYLNNQNNGLLPDGRPRLGRIGAGAGALPSPTQGLSPSQPSPVPVPPIPQVTPPTTGQPMIHIHDYANPGGAFQGAADGVANALMGIKSPMLGGPRNGAPGTAHGPPTAPGAGGFLGWLSGGRRA